MLRRGDPVTFAAVARAAGVSTWLVYADGVREHIQSAATRQAAQPAAALRTGQAASETSLRTDLELARDQIRQLRAERDELRDQVRAHLGRQFEQLGRKGLTDRISELTRHPAAENRQLRQRVTDLEDELTATRTRLRRMIRETSKA